MKTSFERRGRVAALILCVGIALAGCGQRGAESGAPKADNARDKAANEAGDERAASSDDLDALASKLENYVDCYNRVDGDVHKSIDRYGSWVKDMKAGPSGRETVVYGLYTVGADDIAKCKTTFADAASAAPKLAELDAAGGRYVEALAAVGALIDDTHTYYDRENYKDDGFAKAKTMHGPLVAGFDAFDAASDAFSAALERENDAMLNARLAQIEKSEGKHAAYFQLAVMNRAKSLVGAMQGDEFDVAKAADALARYETIADEAIAYAKGGGQVPMMWSSFASETEDFRKDAKSRLRRVRDKEPYDQGERMLMSNGSGGWMVEGSPDQLIRSYNELVESSNRL